MEEVASRRSNKRPNAGALFSIVASQQRTNARMDREMFIGAEQEFRRVGGRGPVVLRELADDAARVQEAAAQLPRGSQRGGQVDSADEPPIDRSERDRSSDEQRRVRKRSRSPLRDMDAKKTATSKTSVSATSKSVVCTATSRRKPTC
mmetsp:Transcript_31015/g.68524  ORF Transcript_31015/g.68524 Transcript_31015/m.68524 type:complete len:148 (+) Transcript_31015:75-518(+)